MFLHYRGIGVFWAKIPLNLTSEGLKCPQEVQVRHETCSTICGTPVQAILDQNNLTGLAGHTVSHVTLLVSSGKFMSGSAFSGRCFFFVRGALIFGQGGAPFISRGHFLDLEKSTAKFRGA